ncbi:MAG: hypothetical protein QM796_20305 [Chthoniobacteraceae bacterium]
MQTSKPASGSTRFMLTLASLATAPVGLLLWALRLRRPDPWRRTLGLGLRSQGCQFALGTFGLDPFEGEDLPTDRAEVEAALAEKLSTFLRDEADLRFALQHYGAVVKRVKKSVVDVAVVRYGANDELTSMETRLDPSRNLLLPGSEQAAAERTIIESYNLTRHFSEIGRVQELKRLVFQGVRGSGIARTAYCRRILGSVCVAFLPGSGEERFSPPDFHRWRIPGSGFLQVFCRWQAVEKRVDVWLHVHHTGADGGSMQELLDRLEKAWPVTTPAFPKALAEDTAPRVACAAATAGERQIHLASAFLDFRPLLALRKRLAATGDMPVVALLLWLMERQPEFAGRKFAVAVEVPDNGEFPRAVDLIGIAPGAFREKGLPTYAAEFQRLVAGARSRRGVTFRAMRGLALLPAGLAGRVMRANPALAEKTFGTMGVSMLRTAKVFVAPMADGGFDDGFIAIGGLHLPGEAGTPVGSITIKGDAEKVARYPVAIQRAINEAANFG